MTKLGTTIESPAIARLFEQGFIWSRSIEISVGVARLIAWESRSRATEARSQAHLGEEVEP